VSAGIDNDLLSAYQSIDQARQKVLGREQLITSLRRGMDDEHRLRLEYAQAYSSLTGDYEKAAAELIVARQKIDDRAAAERKIMNLEKKIKDLIQNQEAGSIAVEDRIGAVTGQLAVTELKINRLEHENWGMVQRLLAFDNAKDFADQKISELEQEKWDMELASNKVKDTADQKISKLEQEKWDMEEQLLALKIAKSCVDQKISEFERPTKRSRRTRRSGTCSSNEDTIVCAP
jgi:chromosome segregation ATPase